MPHSTRRHQLSSLFISLALIVCFVSVSQAQSALDGFDPNADFFVRAVALQPDGKILIGGEFNNIGSTPRNRIARLNPDGSLDTFDPNAGGTVNCSINVIVVQPDGKILIGGDFTTLAPNGGAVVTRNNIARLNPDGSLDTDFNPNANGIVYVITVQADGKVLVGGAFNGAGSIGGQTRNRIARVDATTGAVDSFNPNADNFGFPTPNVYAITVQADGKILVGGGFGTIGGQTRRRIARLDPVTGAADSFDPNVVDTFGTVQEIVLQPDGKILVGGGFGNIGGQLRNNIARLDPVTGAADSWNPNADNTVYAMALQPDGKVLIGGDFSTVGGMTTFMARLHPVTGAPETTFNPVFSDRVFAIAVQPDGKIVAGGIYTTVSGITRNRIARVETNGLIDQTLDLNIFASLSNNFAVYTTAVQPDGKILIGGNFNTFVAGVVRSRIARLNADGTLDTAFDPQANETVFSIAVQTDGKILVGGFFTAIGGQTRNRIARLNADGTLDTAFNPNANGGVNSIAVQTDGRILVSGSFTAIGGQTRNRIARLNNLDGSLDAGFDPNANAAVFAIALQPDGKILIGGEFGGANSIGAATRNCIARLDAVTGAADSFNPNAGDDVTTIAVQADGKILAGGNFTSIGGQTRNRIARLDPTTGMADLFNPNASDAVYSIVVQADGQILVGGNFFGTNSISGQTRNYIARLSSASGLADTFDPNANATVLAITLQTDGKILVGGFFLTTAFSPGIGGQPRKLFARLSNDTAAMQNLVVTQSAVTWTRGGSSPTLARVTFESSTDNATYTFLGNGTPSGSGWALTGLSLPTGQNIYIRARGYYRGGVENASESITESVRNAFISPSFTISGTVTYGNAIGNPVPPRFVKNVSVASTAGSPAVGPVITGTPGTYALTGFGAGSYTIKPTKPGGATTAITSNDAARVAQGVTGSLPFVSQNQRFAADVTGNGNISSQDAAKIAQFVAGLPFSPPNLTGQWKFFVTGAPSPLPTPPQTYDDGRSYASVTTNQTGEDFVGILVGEVSGNWNPATHPRGAVFRGQMSDVSEDGRAGEKPITVAVGDIVAVGGKDIVVPVNVEGVFDKDVISYEFDLRYDPAVMQPLVEAVDVMGTVSRGLSVVVNPYEPGLLRVVVYGAMPIVENGVLLNLRFTAVGVAGAVSPLTFERIMFNEGETALTLTDGRVVLSEN